MLSRKNDTLAPERTVEKETFPRKTFDGILRFLVRRRRRRRDERSEIEAMAREAAARLAGGRVTLEGSLRLPAHPDSLSERMLEAKNLGFLKARCDLAGKRVLVVGAGLGREGFLLLSAGAARVTLLDLSETAVGHGSGVLNTIFRRKAAATGAAAAEVAKSFGFASAAGVAADAVSPPFKSGSFDLVVAWQCLHHLSDQARACAEWARVGREVYFLSEPSKMPIPAALLMKIIGWNTEYGGLCTGRVDAATIAKSLGAVLVTGSTEGAASADGAENCDGDQAGSVTGTSGAVRNVEAATVLEVERIWQYFPRLFNRFSGSVRFNACWFTFLWCLDHLFPGEWTHTVNGRIFRI